MLDHRAIAELSQRDRPQSDLGRKTRVAQAEVQQVRLHDEVPDQQADRVGGDEAAKEPQAQPVHRGVRGEPKPRDALGDDNGGHGDP